MPASKNPIDPPKLGPAHERPRLPDPEPRREQPPVPRPDVTAWVERINERLEPSWQENEIRGGRSFHMGFDVTSAEVAEVMDVFRKGWDVGACRTKQGITLILKPRRETRTKR